MLIAIRRNALAKDQRGNVTVLVAAGMVLLCGFAAVSVDVGRAYADRQRLHDAIDAAALAGAVYLPDRDAAAVSAAVSIAADNGVTDNLSVTFPDSRTIAVEAAGSTNLFFAPILDSLLSEIRFRITSRAMVSGIAAVPSRSGSGGGAVPLATELTVFAYGERVTLKVGPGDGTGGNFHPLALGASGADAYLQNLQGGYSGVVRVGDRYYTEPGNMAGPTQRGVDRRIDQDPAAAFDTVRPGSPRLVFVPVVDTFVGADGRDLVEVRGFAAFFLDGANGGEITGRFIRWILPGEPGGPDFGLGTVRLRS